MSLYHFRLPDIGEGVAEAEIAVWHVQPGDYVKEDQSLVDVMTDKATVDMTSPVEGKVLAIHGAVGDMMPVGGILVELEVEGQGNADTQAETARTPEPAPAPPPPPAATEAASPPPERKAPASPPPSPRRENDAPLAAPATRRHAHDLGIPLEHVPGTGPGGRITPDDLDAFIAAGRMAAERPASSLHLREGIKESRITGLRRKIAERMEEASRRIPHISYVEECDLTELEALRVDLNAHSTPDQPQLTLLPFFIRALVMALPDFPHINAHYDDEGGVLRQFAGVHVGIATQTPNGLMVPVLHHAEGRDIWDCAREITRLSTAAREGRATREELSGSTISITSLGALGGIATTPILNRPEVAIIGPNKLVDRPMVEGSFISRRKMMNLSSSFDHRIVDGHDAALFIARVKRLLEHPALLFMP